MPFTVCPYRRFPLLRSSWHSTNSCAILLFAICLTGCGHFFAKDSFISALGSGQIKQGTPSEEVRKLAGEPSALREIDLNGIPLIIWEYLQTGVDDSDKYTRLVAGTYGLAGFMPVNATEKHLLFFSQNRVVAWDSKATLIGGTAFAISNHHLLTNFHVVEGLHFLQVRLGDGSAPVVLSMADQEKDIAVLELSPDSIDAQPHLHSDVMLSGWLELGEDTNMRQGDPVWTLGYPLTDALGGSSVLMQGLISSLSGLHGDSEHFLISVPLQPGNSGGPLFNQEGKVIGITSSVLNPTKLYAEQKVLPQSINFAVKIGEVRALLRKGGMTISQPAQKRPISQASSLTSLAEAVSPYVAAVSGIRFEPIKYKVRPKQKDPPDSY